MLLPRYIFLAVTSLTLPLPLGAAETTATDASLAVVEKRDFKGNVVERDVGDDAATMKVYRYTYDDAGHCTAATDPVGRTSQYTRDKQGRVIKLDVLNGDSQQPTKTVMLTYDPNGNIDGVSVDGVKQAVDGKKFEWVNEQLQVDGTPADRMF